MPDFEPKNLEIAKANGGIVDLQPGEYVLDGDGERAKFLSYGDYAPIYVNLAYKFSSKTFRLPNSELRRTR